MKKLLLVFSFVVLTGFVALAGAGISCNQSRYNMGGGDYLLITTCDNGEAYLDAYLGGRWY